MSIAVSLNYSPDRRSPLRRSSFRRSGVSRGLSRRSPCRLSPWRRSPLRRSSLGCSLLNCITASPPNFRYVYEKPYQKLEFLLVVFFSAVMRTSKHFVPQPKNLARELIDIANDKNHTTKNYQFWGASVCTTMKRSLWMYAVPRTG